MPTDYDATEAARLVAECLELADKATPGPWETSDWRVFSGTGEGERIKVITCTAHNAVTRTEENANNATFIGASRTLAPALASQLEAAGREIAAALPLVSSVLALHCHCQCGSSDCDECGLREWWIKNQSQENTK